MRFRFKYKNLLLLSILSVLLLSLFISPMIQADGKTTVSNADASVIDESTIAVSVAFNSAEHNNSRLLNSKARNLSLSDLNRLIAEQFDGDFKDANPRDSEKEFIRKKNGCGEASKFRQQEDNWQITNIILNIPGEGCSDILNELDIVVALRNQENFDIEAAEGEEDGNSCEAQGKLSWFLCPVIQAMDSALNWVDTQIERLLVVDKSFYNNDGMKDAASSIRNIAYIILVPITLVMVIGTAIGVNAFDAYTVKKALPRMAIATVFIGLSYQIGVFLIELFNSIGQGTLGIMTLPFGDKADLTLDTLFGPGTSSRGVLSLILLIPKVIAFGIGAALVVWFFGFTVLLFAGIAFIVLMMRQLFIVALLLIAPLAILAWIFPGNDKLWKSWWSIYSKLLIMFPLIMGLLAVGRIFAYIIESSGPDSSALSGGALEPFAKLAAYMLPYAFIPFTFKFAGGLFATVSGAMNDKSRGLFDRQKKSRAGKADRMRNQNMFRNASQSTRIGRMKGRLNTAGAGVMNINQAGLDPRHMRTRMRQALRTNSEDKVKDFMETKEFRAIAGDDAQVWASRFENRQDIEDALVDDANGGDSDRFGGAHNILKREEAVENILRAQHATSNSTYHKARVRAQAKTGTGYQYEDDNGEIQFDVSRMLRDINGAYGADRNGAGMALAEMKGNLTNSGQIAGLAGYGKFATHMENMYRAQHDTPNEQARVAQEAHEAIMDDADRSITAGQALYGKPSSTAAIGASRARTLQNYARSMATGVGVIQVRERGENGHMRDAMTRDENGNEVPLLRAANIDDLAMATAPVAGLYDAAGSAGSPQNVSALKNALFDAKIEPVEIPLLDSDGNPTGQVRTVDDVFGLIETQMGGNQEYKRRRRDIASSIFQQAQNENLTPEQRATLIQAQAKLSAQDQTGGMGPNPIQRNF